jgi:hypothetical protein
VRTLGRDTQERNGVAQTHSIAMSIHASFPHSCAHVPMYTLAHKALGMHSLTASHVLAMSRWGVLDQAVRAMDINGDGMIHKREFRQV